MKDEKKVVYTDAPANDGKKKEKKPGVLRTIGRGAVKVGKAALAHIGEGLMIAAPMLLAFGGFAMMHDKVLERDFNRRVEYDKQQRATRCESSGKTEE